MVAKKVLITLYQMINGDKITLLNLYNDLQEETEMI